MSTRTRAPRQRSVYLRFFIAAGMTCCAASTGCNPPAAPAPAAVSDVVERGPYQLTASATPAEAWFGDSITLELRVRTPNDTAVRFPAANAFDGLEVTIGPAQDARPAAEGGLEWRQSYAIAALQAGVLEIPPAAVQYARRPESPEAAPDYQQELVTGTLKINVRSALTTQDSVQAPRDITGARTPARRRNPWQIAGWIAGAAALLGLGCVAHLMIRRWLRRPTPPVAPEVWALRALQELSAGDWIAAGRIREYYYRLSEVVRAYIERKFGLAAPEMTTEEFLNSLTRERTALPCEPGALRAFLTACDIVKYAGYMPDRASADDALGTARAFINSTAAAAARTPGGASRFHREVREAAA
jgi:hypothetical protein